jgi:ABC-type nitrate/sulfonate/bicarbonate transport system substrate-binding protein
VRNSALVLALLVAWPGIAAAQVETVRIAVPKLPAFFPVFAAESLGLYAEEGVRVEFLDLPGPRASQAMIEGRADLSATFAEQPITFLREGKAIKNLMALLNQNPIGEGPAFVREMNFTTLQASDTMLRSRPDTVSKVVRAVVRAQKRLRDDDDDGALAFRIALLLFPGMDAAVIQVIIDADRPTYHPEITEEAMRQVHASLRGGLLPADDPPIPFADVVAVKYRPLWRSQ